MKMVYPWGGADERYPQDAGRVVHSGGGGPAPKAATRVAASTPPPSI